MAATMAAAAAAAGGGGGDAQTVVSTTATAAVSVKLHPLVIINVSEHAMRTRMQTGEHRSVFGALLGSANGRELEVTNSFELVMKVEGGAPPAVDHEYLAKKQEQLKLVFPKDEFLGWYRTGSGEPTTFDLEVQRSLSSFNESPIHLQIDSAVAGVAGERLPICIFESMVDTVDGRPRTLFVAVPYTIVTSESERIAVDHIAQISNAGAGDTTKTATHLQSQHNAVEMLYRRVGVIKEYVQKVVDGQLVPDYGLLRDIAALARALPVLGTPRFHEESLTQCNDALLTAYLATLTEGSNALNELVTKVQVVSAPDRGPGGGGRVDRGGKMRHLGGFGSMMRSHV